MKSRSSPRLTPQQLDQQTQAVTHLMRCKQLLPLKWFSHKAGGNHIGEDLRRFKLQQMIHKIRGKRNADLLDTRAKLQNFCTQSLRFYLISEFGLHKFDASDSERFFLRQAKQADPDQSLENEV